MTLTPAQFNKLATKEDLNELEEKLEKKLVSKKEFNELITVADHIVKKLDDIEHAFVSNQAAHDRFEKRITRLEKTLKLNPMF